MYHQFIGENKMTKFFKKANSRKTDEMYVVRIVNKYPVKAIKREDRPTITNVSVKENWNRLTTFDVYEELSKQFKEVFGHADPGLCAYLSQCIVNPMWEAKMESMAKVEPRVVVCDMSMIFCYDFELHDGSVITAEDVMKALVPYIPICDWDESGEMLELKVTINVK